ncbi:MAG: GNAT family N-acetyltransferase [Chloroflexi bacterium]|nr:GNAT family N-acetyltransferase [Chloroflexota bacterium]
MTEATTNEIERELVKPTGSLKVRPLVRDDKPATMAILRALPEFKPAEVVVAEELIDCYLNTPGSGYFIAVAEIDASIAGYVCYGPTPLTEGTWDLYWIAVDRARQGQGIGQALVAFTEAKVREAGGRLLLIETSGKPEYEKTIRFYHAAGYEIVSRIPDFYAPGDDRLVFQKRF